MSRRSGVQFPCDLQRRTGLDKTPEDTPDELCLALIDDQSLVVVIHVVAEWRRPSAPLAATLCGGDLVADAFPGDLALVLREGHQDAEHQASRRVGGVELLRDRDETHILLFENLDHAEEIEQGARQPVDLVNDNDIDLTVRDVLEQPFERRALHRPARESAIVILAGRQFPSARGLASNERLAGFALGVEGVEFLLQTVLMALARIAEGKSESCCGPSSCCGGNQEHEAAQLAQSIGYDADELANLPEGANMGLSCGNPVALASLREGEVVLDLGSGGGFDVFIAGRKVGATGRAIGVDMTPEMISKARRNLEAYRERSGLDNVEFRLGEIEHLPVADASVDAVMSNCVINLSPDKPQVWREIARVLKPGGRVLVSDIALLKPLPENVQASVEALVGCVAGAALMDETKAMVHAAGLTDARFERKSGYVDNMPDWPDPVSRKLAGHFPPGTKPSDFVTSLNVTARKA